RWPRDWSSDVCSSDLEARDNRALGLVQFGSRNLFVADALELFHELYHRAGCDFRADVAAGAPRSGIFHRGKAAVDAVGVALLFKIGRASCRERVEIAC